MFSVRLKELRKKHNLTQSEFAKQFNISNGAIGNWESGKREPDSETMSRMADYFNVSVDYLLGRTDDPSSAGALAAHNAFFAHGNIPKYPNIREIHLKKFPLLGEIACGKPVFANEDKESYIMAGMDIAADFCLVAKGDSMINARINNGDIVFIRKMPIVDNGEIAAVVIDDEATLKRVYYYPESNKLVLNAENPKYEPIVYMDEELNHVCILGKAVYFMSAI